MTIEQILQAIREAEAHGLVQGHDESVLTGFSGRKLIGALQRFARLAEGHADACYLEVGVFQGLTLLSVAAANPRVPCYGVDNFAYFDRQGRNMSLVLERKARLKADNATLINLDYEDALESLASHIGPRKLAVYFVDGPHDYRSQLMCLELALPYLHESAVIVIDDCNYRHVRQANRDFLVTHPDYALAFEGYTARHPDNMTPAENAAARTGWWNGVNIIVRDPARALSRSYPPTLRSRAQYENEHYVHASDVGPHVVQALKVVQMVDGHHPRGLVRALWRLNSELRETRAERAGLHGSMNTYSDDLPTARYCALARPGEG